MNNCLHKTLKKVVNDSDLNELGTVIGKFHLRADATLLFGSKSGTECRIKVLTDGITISSVTGSHFSIISPTEAIISDGGYTGGSTVVFSAGNTDVKLKITNKYNLATLDRVAEIINEDAFTFMSELEYFKVDYYTAGRYDLEWLKQSTKMKYFLFNNEYLYGNIAELGAMTSLGTLYIDNSNVEGELESFVAAQVHNGRTSTSVAITSGINLGKVLYKGARILALGAKSISWVESSGNTVITYGGEDTTIHVNSDGSWTRVS